ncbi:MAG TPA: Rieske 2Fe-2S domain-containing protein [bacterium]|nr:Rieske 2Fe-2S domain-containing protein [bacterium]
MGWTRICASAEIANGEYVVAGVAGRSLVVARVGGVVHAVENVCGHQTRRMDGGALRLGPAGEPCLECPHHAMCFDLRDGHIVEDAGHQGMDPVRAFAAREEAGAVFVELPD